MRRFVQKQMLELVSSICDGVSYAISPNVAPASASAVLDDCRAAVQAIDNSLKPELSTERYFFYKRMNDILLGMLEELARRMINGQSISTISENMENQFNLIYGELMNESEVKLEIAFLPYKSSMWDSLESIWRAAKDDPDCDCYVVPIPYYDRNPDDSISSIYYEGKDFPADVPITDFNSYDLSARRPDAIYIHNPFDDCNRATAVPPAYYSSELKKYTEMLVYVPYYVMGGAIADSQKIVLPVFHHMDIMVVQAEKYKQLYETVVTRNKLLALGSPKVDRMVYFENHRPSLPFGWGDIVRNKKVVMYNVSIAGILDHGIQAIKKMMYVFSRFSERNDIILLWRPHPLIESTLKSMNPSLLNIYLQAKQQYISNKIGIYDTTPDITASVALSDAYIGEETSSVVHLFGVVGKPVFLMREAIDQAPREDDIASVSFHDAFFEDDSVWFVANVYHALCKMDLSSGKIEVIARLPLDSDRFGQYCDVIKIEDKVYLLPMNASEIGVYDLKEKTFEQTPLPDPIAPNFDRMVRYKGSLFMKPKCYPAIVQYDIKTGACTYYREWLEEFKGPDNQSMFMWGVGLRDRLLLMASSAVNKVLEFDMETGLTQVHIVGPTGFNYFGMAFDGTDYWLIPNEGRAIVRWNYETGKTTVYNDYPPGFVGETRGFCGIVCCGSYMLAFPREANMIIRIDVATGGMSEYKLALPNREGEPNSIYPKWDSQYYFMKKIDEKHVAALTTYDRSLLIVNTESGECAIKKCRLGKDDVEQFLRTKEHFRRVHDNIPYACSESMFVSLDRFIDRYVVSDYNHNKDAQKQAYSVVIDNMDGTCGEKVHRHVKGQLFTHEE